MCRRWLVCNRISHFRQVLEPEPKKEMPVQGSLECAHAMNIRHVIPLNWILVGGTLDTSQIRGEQGSIREASGRHLGSIIKIIAVIISSGNNSGR